MIDAHHHLWDVSAREHRWLMGGQSWASDEELARLRRSFRLADLAPLAAASGVTGTVVIQTVAEPWETPDLLTLAAGGDPYGAGGGAHAKDAGTAGAGVAGAGVAGAGAAGAGVAGAAVTGAGAAGGLLAGVVGWTDLTAPDVTGAVAGLRAQRGGAFLCGIRHPVLAEADPDWLARPSVLRGLSALAGSGLCFDVVVAPHQLAGAVTAARSVPGLTFVLDHLGSPPAGPDAAGPWGRWAHTIAELGALPNVVCKLSGAHSSPVLASDLRPSYERVLAAFGPSRLMFGSDWPVSSLAAPYGDVCAVYRELVAELSSAEQGAIFSGTARRVYGLRLQSRRTSQLLPWPWPRPRLLRPERCGIDTVIGVTLSQRSDVGRHWW